MYTDWITTSAAAIICGIPQSLINQAIVTGALTARTVIGEVLVSREHVTAMAARMRLLKCERCGDD